ncbi:hypothetical protein ABEB36_011211 [Hypothenemus hampei]|uniref:Cell division cycle protein 123 homolog n=1 Tax=Hypothenemus hampei TaxID=57062 RepID=A0ABD1EEV1_HYPHA
MLETVDLKDFSIKSWYENFKNITLQTIILQLSDDIVKNFEFQELSEESDDESLTEETPFPQDFLDEVQNAFNTLGRTVFVKNNWHAPLDARMFSIGNTLKAENISDIQLFLQTSSVIQQDLSNVKGVPFCLALRKWISIHPAAEFRCIVINNVLRGITPRDWPVFYSHFKEEGSRIIQNLFIFFTEFIKMKFPRTHYCFDVVLSYPDKPFLLDFGPLNSKTNLYAFTWTEISSLLDKVRIFNYATFNYN